jgi:uncharacterized protein
VTDAEFLTNNRRIWFSWIARVFCVVCLSTLALFCGCKKNRGRPAASEIHAITQALASEAAGQGATVRIRKAATDEDPNSRDFVRAKLKGEGSADNRQAAVQLLQQLQRVATTHKLTEDAPVFSGRMIRAALRRAGVVTHEIEIETAGPKSSGGGARLAIILDDLGNDLSAARAIFAMGYPVTLSVLPNHLHSKEIAQEAHQRGYEVMLHLPMESIGKEQREEQELRPGMSSGQVVTLVNDLLARVPYAQGVNNHQGSEATSSEELMSELMPVLRNRGLFYIDSRTTTATVAYDTAQENDVRSGFRSVPFLDDVEQVPAIRKQLELAFRGAKEKGEAIAIGHPHSATLDALRDFLPRADAQGIQLVKASELVH